MSSDIKPSVLVRMPNWLGDCIMTLPALRTLAAWLPEADIYLAGRGQFRDLFLAQPGIAGFVEAPGSGLGKLVSGLWNVRHTLRGSGLPERIDLGILFTNSFSTAVWMWRAGPRRRVGYDLDGRRLFLTDPAPCGETEKSWHFVRYYGRLIARAEQAAGASLKKGARQLVPITDYEAPRLVLSGNVRYKARELLTAHGLQGRYAVLAPASAYGAVKDWPPAHYRRLAALLGENFSLPVAVTGAAGQADICRAIADSVPGAVNLAGKTTMMEFAGLLAEADLFVGGDSGGAHMAGALEIPTVVIFGITNPTRTRPGGKLVTSLGEGKEHDIKLSTPEARDAAKKALAAIEPGAVLAAAKEMMCRR